MHDPRFPPLTASQLPGLEVEVTVLLGFAVLVLDVPLRGSLLLLAAIARSLG